MDPEYIAEKMNIARAQCADFAVYMRELEGFKQSHPHTEVYLLLYQQVILEITLEVLLPFCKQNKINTIICADMTDGELKQRLIDAGIQIAASINYTMSEQEMELVKTANGFVYLQAMPNENDTKEGKTREYLKVCLQKLREAGITRPIYCGVGIRTPEDVAFVKGCGAEGFFIGSTIMKYYDDPDALVEAISMYKQAGA
jgi:tryptophan synthase alpha chain